MVLCIIYNRTSHVLYINPTAWSPTYSTINPETSFPLEVDLNATYHDFAIRRTPEIGFPSTHTLFTSDDAHDWEEIAIHTPDNEGDDEWVGTKKRTIYGQERDDFVSLKSEISARMKMVLSRSKKLEVHLKNIKICHAQSKHLVQNFSEGIQKMAENYTKVFQDESNVAILYASRKFRILLNILDRLQNCVRDTEKFLLECKREWKPLALQLSVPLRDPATTTRSKFDHLIGELRWNLDKIQYTLCLGEALARVEWEWCTRRCRYVLREAGRGGVDHEGTDIRESRLGYRDSDRESLSHRLEDRSIFAQEKFFTLFKPSTWFAQNGSGEAFGEILKKRLCTERCISPTNKPSSIPLSNFQINLQEPVSDQEPVSNQEPVSHTCESSSIPLSNFQFNLQESVPEQELAYEQEPVSHTCEYCSIPLSNFQINLQGGVPEQEPVSHTCEYCSIPLSNFQINLQEPVSPTSESSSIPVKNFQIDHLELKYKSTKSLNNGAFKTIYRGEWYGQEVAIAIMVAIDDLEYVVEKEAGFLLELQHPNIVAFYGYSYTRDGRLPESKDTTAAGYLVMELMEGDLSQAIERRSRSTGPFSISVALDIMLQIVEGMIYLHEQGIMHRDLKPKNCLVKARSAPPDVYYTVKLTDFGSAREMHTECTSDLFTVRPGTTRWMAPEMLGTPGNPEKVKYTKSVDVYGFAIISYQVVTGEALPMREIKARDVMKAVRNGARPSFPASLSCPEALKQLIINCWHGVAGYRPTFVDIRQRLWTIRKDVELGE